jgi:hypothetical protein
MLCVEGANVGFEFSRIESSRSYYMTELFKRTFGEVDGRARGLCVCFM